MGASGSSASLTLGTFSVSTLDAGSNATLSIVNSGTSLDNVWNMSFGLPRGIDGTDGTDGVDGTNGIDGVDGVDGIDGVDGVDGTNGINGINGISSTITLGTVTTETLPSTSSALVTVTNSGSINDAIFNLKFQIPQGIQGEKGDYSNTTKI